MDCHWRNAQGINTGRLALWKFGLPRENGIVLVPATAYVLKMFPESICSCYTILGILPASAMVLFKRGH
jgi:hypothetical protein